MISTDGGTPRWLPVAEFDVVSPSWMRNGTSIFFYAAGSTLTPGALKIVDLKALQVTAIPDSQNLVFPVASADGRYIAATSVDGKKLMLFDFSIRKWSVLVQTDVGLTTWSRDSNYIYFDAGLSENPAFYRARVADRKLERVADLKGLRRVVSAFLPWSGVTPEGAPLLLRDVSSQEVYALDFEAP